jgi:hypothetical protein
VRHAPAVLLVAFSAAACATAPGGEPLEASLEPTRSSAVLFVERQAAEGPNSTAHVGARFVQFTGLAADALPDLLGIPRVPEGVVGCHERGDTPFDTSGGRAEARLLDVGPIEVRAGDSVLRLEPRRFPDLWNVVSGVIYATDGELPSDAWRFSAPGNLQSRVGAFDVEARAPEELSGLAVAEQALTPGATVQIPRRAFAVRWVRGERDDGLVVTFESGPSAARPSTITCTARDEGLLEIDAGWADRIAELARAGATIHVHRVRARPFNVPQLDAAQVVFDVSVRGHAAAAE